MYEAKTKPTGASVSAFIAAVENETRRADAKVLAKMIAEITGEKPKMWGPSMVGYGSYRAATGDWPIAGFSPRKANLVVYLLPGFDKAGALLAKLGKHKIGKSCLYLNKLADVDVAVLRALIERSVKEMRKLYG